MKNEYNGWYNKQTWNINLMYGETFQAMADEQEYEDVDHMAESFESIVDELEFQCQGLREGSLAHQAVGEYLDAVNWQELAEHFFKEKVEEEEDNEHHMKGLRELLAEAEVE
jgi:hypothetical protein